MRTHGFEPPFDWRQILAWFLTPFFFVGFFMIHSPGIEEDFKIPITVIFVVLFAISIIFNALSSGSNAADPGIYLPPAQMNTPRNADDDDVCFCSYCEAFVHKTSKHCRACDKCVIGFDHHCKWLNNCIGVHNYRVFLVYVGDTFVATLFQLGVGGYVLYRLCVEGPSVFPADPTSVTSDPYPGYYIYFALVCVYLFLQLVACLLLGHLFGFHLWLIYHKMTTYEYIIKQRKLAKEKAEQLKIKQEQEAAEKEKALAAASAPQAPPQTDKAPVSRKLFVPCQPIARHSKTAPAQDTPPAGDQPSTPATQQPTPPPSAPPSTTPGAFLRTSPTDATDGSGGSAPPLPPPPGEQQQQPTGGFKPFLRLSRGGNRPISSQSNVSRRTVRSQISIGGISFSETPRANGCSPSSGAPNRPDTSTSQSLDGQELGDLPPPVNSDRSRPPTAAVSPPPPPPPPRVNRWVCFADAPANGGSSDQSETQKEVVTEVHKADSDLDPFSLSASRPNAPSPIQTTPEEDGPSTSSPSPDRRSSPVDERPTYVEAFHSNGDLPQSPQMQSQASRFPHIPALRLQQQQQQQRSESLSVVDMAPPLPALPLSDENAMLPSQPETNHVEEGSDEEGEESKERPVDQPSDKSTKPHKPPRHVVFCGVTSSPDFDREAQQQQPTEDHEDSEQEKKCLSVRRLLKHLSCTSTENAEKVEQEVVQPVPTPRGVTPEPFSSSPQQRDDMQVVEMNADLQESPRKTFNIESLPPARKPQRLPKLEPLHRESSSPSPRDGEPADHGVELDGPIRPRSTTPPPHLVARISPRPPSGQPPALDQHEISQERPEHHAHHESRLTLNTIPSPMVSRVRPS